MHPHQVRRLDEVAAHRTGNHQVEHVADEAQEHRRAQREPRLDHPDQKIPAHIRDEQAALEDQHTEYKQAEVERVSEDRAASLLPHRNGLQSSHVSKSDCSTGWPQSTPLVDGISADRGSGSAASRMACARPLKIASLMWWVLRP